MYALFWGFCLGASFTLCQGKALCIASALRFVSVFLAAWGFFSFILFFSISLAVGKTLILHKV